MVRHTGKVAKWLNHKGIGFITPNEGGDGSDILVHFEQIKQESEDGFKSLQVDSTVEYELMPDPKNSEKMIACKVTGEGGADCQPKVKGKGKGKWGNKPKSGESSGGSPPGSPSSRPKGKGKGKKGKGKGKGKDSGKD